MVVLKGEDASCGDMCALILGEGSSELFKHSFKIHLCQIDISTNLEAENKWLLLWYTTSLPLLKVREEKSKPMNALCTH